MSIESVLEDPDANIRQHSPDRAYDRVLAGILSDVSDVLGVLPGFGFYDDSDSANAFASPSAVLKRPDGSVVFGLTLLEQLRRAAEYPDVAVAAVCAHEFGHIIQFARGIYRKVSDGQSTSKHVELQADYFAGYYAGVKKARQSDYPSAVVAFTQYQFGDNDFTNPDHHGTEEGRGAAVVEGFKGGKAGYTTAEAIEASIRYVADR
jgi:predicted metalloprotease